MGGAPSREATTVFSHFRGTYEIGLIPLTKAFFGRSRGKEDSSAASVAHRASTEELRRQFVLMRSDPAIVYANAREKAMVSWSDLLSHVFTEDDLDNFLEKIEKELYNTDAEMIADSDRPILPVPCALCLVCKDGQERPGCFLWQGRNIVVIGYFGCMTEAAHRAFKIVKGKPACPTPPHSSGGGGGGRPIQLGHPHSSNDVCAPSLDPTQLDGVHLYMNAAVLASAGDRTQERVLVLAAVMLRNQYLEAVSRATGAFYFSTSVPIHPTPTSTTPVTRGLMHINGNSEEKYSVASPNSSNVVVVESHTWGNGRTTSQAKEEALRVLERRLLHLTIGVEAAMDNYSSLKSLTENVAFLQCQTDVDPQLCMVHLPDSILTTSKQSLSGEDSVRSGSATHAPGKPPPETTTTPPHATEPPPPPRKASPDAHGRSPTSSDDGPESSPMITTTEATGTDTPSAATSGASIPVPDADAALMTAPSLLVPRAPEMDGEVSGRTYHEDFAPTGAASSSGESSMAEKADGEAVRLTQTALVDLICVRFAAPYVANAALWASGLLTAPTRIPGGAWVQYKLKDESEHLRQTLHGKDAIVARWRTEQTALAARYMGDVTGALLRHVRVLQEEVERARARPPESWPEAALARTREGRTCALHRTPFGTMLVGIRSQRKEDTGGRKAERKRRPTRETDANEGEAAAPFGAIAPTRAKSSVSGSDSDGPPRSAPAVLHPVLGAALVPAAFGGLAGGRSQPPPFPFAPPVYLPPPPFQTGGFVLGGSHPSGGGGGAPFGYTLVNPNTAPTIHVPQPQVQAPTLQPQPQAQAQTLQQQQQIMFVQQATGPGGVPVLVPLSTPARPAATFPPYGLSVLSGAEQTIFLTAAQQTAQQAAWNTIPGNPMASVAGLQNAVYYFPTQ